MNNWIDLSNIPMKGKLKSWKNCKHTRVDFSYDGINGYFFIERRISNNKYIVLYDNIEYEMSKICIERCQLGKLFGKFIEQHKYNIGEIIPYTNGKLEVLNQIRMDKNNVRGYTVKCIDCGHSFDIQECNLIRGDGCSVCSNHKVMVGVNDLWTKRPDVAQCLVNAEDGYRYTQFSNQRQSFKCDKCGNVVGMKPIFQISTHGVSCNKCGDGISYPNKLMFNILTFLKISFGNEISFDWCKFPDYNDSTKIVSGRYDYVIDSMNLIIEMDGGLGHGCEPIKHSSYSKEELVYRDRMKDLLAKEHGYKIIRIDCKYTHHNRLDYCKNSIISSDLKNYLNLNLIDWNYIHNQSVKSILIQACEMYNSGKSTSQIAKLLQRDLSTIINYLHEGNTISLCEYPKNLNLKGE